MRHAAEQPLGGTHLSKQEPEKTLLLSDYVFSHAEDAGRGGGGPARRARSAGELTAKPSVFSSSPHQGSWFPAGRQSTPGGGGSQGQRQGAATGSRAWRPLGGTWREWEELAAADSLGQSGLGDPSGFANGVVPHWSKMATVRKKSLLAHDFSWAYYRMRRHDNHPQRLEVGVTVQGASQRGSAGSTGAGFNFWRDLRPPFEILGVRRPDPDPEEPEEAERHGAHPDGELYSVIYQCTLEYVSERSWGMLTDAWTYNNKVHGVARVRIPDGFPQRRPIRIVDWGQPVIKYQPDPKKPDEDVLATAPPSEWSPLAQELGLRGDSQRLSAVRDLSQKTVAFGTEVSPRQKALLGSHASLPELAAVEERASSAPAGQRRGTSAARRPQRSRRSACDGAAPQRVRQHKLFTPAGGIVTYRG